MQHDEARHRRHERDNLGASLSPKSTRGLMSQNSTVEAAGSQ